jgi:polyhydroxyalkanoate synthesis repressor PhaR
MYLIKRYPNRKLYDTEAKQYITLEGIAELVRAGQEIQVTDHVTGEDLTALTFSQIILEQEKRQSGFLPRATLTSLIRAGGDRLSALQRSLGTSKGFMHQVDDEIKQRIAALVSRGEILEAEAQRIMDKLLTSGARSETGQPLDTLDDKIENILRSRDLPTREALDQINRQLDQLTDQLDDLA